MRVAVNVEQLLYPSPGGIGRYTARLVMLLPRLYPSDGLATFCARHTPDEVAAALRAFSLDDVAPPVRLPLPRPLLYDAWHVLGHPSLERLGRGLGPVDLVHAPSLAVPATASAKLVVTVHDLAPVLFPTSFTARGRWFHRSGLRAAERRADLVIAVTQAAANEITSLARIPAERVRVVPHGVDSAPAAAADVARVRARFGLGEDRYVFWLGSHEPRKGLGTLVAAMARLSSGAGDRARRPPLLVLAGYSGWRNEGLVDRADAAKLGDRLIELGTVSEDDLPALYAGASVFAFPSRHEGFGLPVLEAMVQSTPVVCSDIASLAEVTGGAARLVPPEDPAALADAIGDLLGDDVAAARLGAEGCARAAGFTWSRTVRATHAVYEELA